MDQTPTDAPPEKKCPACAEQVKAEAVICRFCGHDFRSGVIAPPPAATPPAPAPTLPPGPSTVPPVVYMQPASKTNGMAIAALVLGIVWMYGIGSILALIFGYQAKGQIDASAGRETGRGMAVAGIVLGWIGVGVLVLTILALASTRSGGY